MGSVTLLSRERTRRAPAERRPGRVVICGSMKVFGPMQLLARQLESANVPVLIPEADSVDLLSLPSTQYDTHKAKASLSYLRAIMHSSTFGVLAANLDLRGVPDYVGPNTFAELAVAFAHGKKIFLLQGLPDQLADELRAWGAIPLNGNLTSLIEFYEMHRVSDLATQSSLF